MAVLQEARTDIGGFKKFILRGKADMSGLSVTRTNKIPRAARRCPECSAQLLPPSEEVASAMRQVAAPSGADIADHAARMLADRLQGNGPARG